jgi:hypothetical protein
MFDFNNFILLIFIFISFINTINSISIKGKLNLAEPTIERLKTVTISLENTNKISHITQEGFFSFHNIEPGFYIIHVNDNLYVYQPIFLDVKENEIKAYDYDFKNGKGFKHRYPFEINASLKIPYNNSGPGIIQNLIKSPYAIIIGITLLMFVCMKMVPEDQLREQQEEMKKQFKNYKGFF